MMTDSSSTHLTHRHCGRASARARNRYSRSWLWIPGSAFGLPQMTARGGETSNRVSGGERVVERRDCVLGHDLVAEPARFLTRGFSGEAAQQDQQRLGRIVLGRAMGEHTLNH